MANPTLRRGDRGEAVAQWQRILGIRPDSVFGQATDRATREFQTKNGLTADGVVGPKTWAAALGSAPAPRPPSATRRLPAIRTRVKPEELYEAIGKIDPNLSRDAKLLLLGHWGLETGDGAGCWGFNIGNVKARPGGSWSWQFFACNEILTPKTAESLVAKAGPREPRRVEDDPAAYGRKEFDNVTSSAVVSSTTKDGKVVLWAFPPNPVCCFRAFESLEEGTRDYLEILQQKFSQSWPFVQAGDCPGFSRALKAQGYYTADEGLYRKALTSRRDKFAKLIPPP